MLLLLLCFSFLFRGGRPMNVCVSMWVRYQVIVQIPRTENTHQLIVESRIDFSVVEYDILRSLSLTHSMTIHFCVVCLFPLVFFFFRNATIQFLCNRNENSAAYSITLLHSLLLTVSLSFLFSLSLSLPLSVTFLNVSNPLTLGIAAIFLSHQSTVSHP